jgi:hypothetical protein
MLNTDARAAALITWLAALDGDLRGMSSREIAFLTTYHTKLGTEPTSRWEDNEMLRIQKKFFDDGVWHRGP